MCFDSHKPAEWVLMYAPLWMQNGNFTISGGDPAMSSNAQGSGADFQVMQNVDMFGFDLQLQPDSSGCSSISTPSTHNVTECASVTRIVRNSSSCCFDTKASDIMHQVSAVPATVEATHILTASSCRYMPCWVTFISLSHDGLHLWQHSTSTDTDKCLFWFSL